MKDLIKSTEVKKCSCCKEKSLFAYSIDGKHIVNRCDNCDVSPLVKSKSKKDG